MLMIEVVFPHLLPALLRYSVERLGLVSKRRTTPPPEGQQSDRIITSTTKHRGHGSFQKERIELTMLRVATMMLKPLQSKGALLDRNHAGIRENQMNYRFAFLIETEIGIQQQDSLVRGLIARGERKLATDCTPATKP